MAQQVRHRLIAAPRLTPLTQLPPRPAAVIGLPARAPRFGGPILDTGRRCGGAAAALQENLDTLMPMPRLPRLSAAIKRAVGAVGAMTGRKPQSSGHNNIPSCPSTGSQRHNHAILKLTFVMCC